MSPKARVSFANVALLALFTGGAVCRCTSTNAEVSGAMVPDTAQADVASADANALETAVAAETVAPKLDTAVVAACKPTECANAACGTSSCGNGCQCAAGAAAENLCSDGLDNDEDGFVDCADWDCAWNPAVTACASKPKICLEN